MATAPPPQRQSWLGSLFGRNGNGQAPPAPVTSGQYTDIRIRQQRIDPPPPPRPGILGWLRSWVGGWAGASYSRHTVADPELRREQINVGPQGIIIPRFARYLSDDVETAEMRRMYRRMLSNGYVLSALLGRLFGVAQLDLQIHPASKKNSRDVEIADFVRYVLTERIKGCVPRLLESILLGALVDGYSISEKVWTYEERGRWAGKYVLGALKPKDVGRVCVPEVDQHDNIVSVLGLGYNHGEHWHPGHFAIYQHLPLYGEPLGTSALRAAYGPWWRLDTAQKLRIVGLDREASGFLLGTYANAENQPAMNAMLSAMKANGWASVPEGEKIEVLDLALSSQDRFANAEKDYKHDIYIAVAGALLQSLEGTVTSGAGNSQVHESTADLFTEHLAESVVTLFNDRESGVIIDLVDLNFVTDSYPHASLGAVDLTEQAAKLALFERGHAMGFDLSQEQMREEFGWEPPTDPADCLPGTVPGAGAVPGATGNSPAGPNPLVTPKPFADSTPAGEGPASPFRAGEDWGEYLRRAGQRHRSNGTAAH